MWSKECNKAFELAKEKLVSADVLVHYDSTLSAKLAGDASAYGVGAVISHVMPDMVRNTRLPLLLKPCLLVNVKLRKKVWL